jgi:hypothetical protein
MLVQMMSCPSFSSGNTKGVTLTTLLHHRRATIPLTRPIQPLPRRVSSPRVSLTPQILYTHSLELYRIGQGLPLSTAQQVPPEQVDRPP